jgi:hypothetical protein
LQTSNLLERDPDLLRCYEALREDVLSLEKAIARRSELRQLTEEANQLMLRNYQEIFIDLVRMYYRDSILIICKLLDDQGQSFGIPRLSRRLIAFVNLLKKKDVSLHDNERHADFIKHHQQALDRAQNSSSSLRFHRDKHLAHSDRVRVKRLGVIMWPDVSSIAEFLKNDYKFPSDEEIRKCAAPLVEIFASVDRTICGRKWPTGLKHDSDFSKVLIHARELTIWRELHDYDSHRMVEEKLNGWWPYRKGSNDEPK